MINNKEKNLKEVLDLKNKLKKTIMVRKENQDDEEIEFLLKRL